MRAESTDTGRECGLRHIWAPWRMKYVGGAKPEGCVLCAKARAEDDESEHVLFRGEHNYVLVNAYPYNSGHLMVVPYAHVGMLVDLDQPTMCEMMQLAQVVSRAIRRCMKPDGINLGMNIGKAAGEGVEEPLHLHVVPRWIGDTNFMTSLAETRVVPQALDDCACQLRPLIEEEARVAGEES